MAIKDAFIGELKHESTLTKKILERVPLENKEWKPHEKSMTIGRLATHVADIPHWVGDIYRIDDFDFMKNYNIKLHTASSSKELMDFFQENLDQALADLEEMKDEDFGKIWTIRRGETVMNSIPKKIAIRGWAFNHLIHHRGQLSVFLRLLNVPVPGMYGPSADER